MWKWMLIALVLMSLVCPVWANDDEKDMWDLKKDEMLVAYVQMPSWNQGGSFRKLVFVPFEQVIRDRDGLYNPKTNLGSAITDGIAQGLLDETQPYGIELQMADPEVVDKTIREKGMSGAGLGNEGMAVQLGQMLQAQAVVYGRVTIDVQTVGEKGRAYWACPAKSGKGVEVKSIKCLIRTITVTLTMKIVSASSGQCLYLYNKGFAETTALQPKLYAAVEDAQPENVAVQQLFTQLVKDVLMQIVPQDVYKVMKTEDVKSKPAKVARKFLLCGDIGQAITLFRDGLAIKSDDHGAWYDLGMAYEITGYLTEARKAYERAYWIKDKDQYFEAIRRLDAQLEAAKPAANQQSSQGQQPSQPQQPQAKPQSQAPAQAAPQNVAPLSQKPVSPAARQASVQTQPIPQPVAIPPVTPQSVPGAKTAQNHN